MCYVTCHHFMTCTIVQVEWVFVVEYSVLQLIGDVLFFAVDFTTVMLYWCKIRSFRQHQHSKQHGTVYQRVQSILHRVLILTFFYQISICWLWAVSISIVLYFDLERDVYPVFIALFLSVAMYLMQEHNTAEYETFLRFLNRSKMYFCCCCCYGMVKEQCVALTAATHMKDGKGAVEIDSVTGFDSGNASLDVTQGTSAKSTVDI